jgi:hypothetical protein
VEAVLKNLGLGPFQYFRSSWNKFDFALVVASAVSVGLDAGPLAMLFRIFRVARVFRLIRASKGLRRLLRTLIVSLPSLANVGGILALLYFIFAIIGTCRRDAGSHGWLPCCATWRCRGAAASARQWPAGTDPLSLRSPATPSAHGSLRTPLPPHTQPRAHSLRCHAAQA